MALFTEKQIRDRFLKERFVRETRTFSAEDVLTEGRIIDSSKEYDIFLSHSSKDQELIAGLKLILNDLGFSVYVDWNDRQLDPNNVTAQTAKILRERMALCKSLIYAYTDNASNSRWMPWEVGYFDGLKNSRVAVLPIIKPNQDSFKGTEFVGIYYIVQIAKIQNRNETTLWIHDGDKYVVFKKWLNGSNPTKH